MGHETQAIVNQKWEQMNVHQGSDQWHRGCNLRLRRKESVQIAGGTRCEQLVKMEFVFTWSVSRKLKIPWLAGVDL